MIDFFLLSGVCQQKGGFRSIAIHIHHRHVYIRHLETGYSWAHAQHIWVKELWKLSQKEKKQHVKIRYAMFLKQSSQHCSSKFISYICCAELLIQKSKAQLQPSGSKKPIKYEYMMDLGENYFGEFFNCVFLTQKTQHICVSL